MSDIVIKAEDLGKSYLISHQTNGKYDTLRDIIADKTKGLLSKIRRPECHIKPEYRRILGAQGCFF